MGVGTGRPRLRDVTTACLEAGRASLGPTLKMVHPRCGASQVDAFILVMEMQISAPQSDSEQPKAPMEKLLLSCSHRESEEKLNGWDIRDFQHRPDFFIPERSLTVQHSGAPLGTMTLLCSCTHTHTHTHTSAWFTLHSLRGSHSAFLIEHLRKNTLVI